MKIRPTHIQDIARLQTVLEETGLFPSEMLPEMMQDFLSNPESQSLWLTCEDQGEPIGFCYAAPEELTDGTWNMLAIAVHPMTQSRGAGAAILASLEALLRERGQRVLIADTSGKDAFSGTRAFYAQNGYTQEARIRDFWAEGDDKITFWKRLG